MRPGWRRLAALGLLLIGCAAPVRPAELDAAVGRWSKADSLERLGSPAERVVSGGEEAWTYVQPVTVSLGSPDQLDPLQPTAAEGGRPLGPEVRDRAPGAGYSLSRRFRLIFDESGVLRRWEPVR
jgi:hypothetical protein